MKFIKYIGLSCLVLLQSCSTGESPFAPSTSGTIRMGSGTGTSFVEGAIGLTNASIPANGSTTMTVNFVDDSEALANTSGTVVFSSTCSGQSLATFSNATATITSGSATTNYTDQGCSGVDSVTATASLADGTQLTATTTITIAASAQGNTIILFTSTDQSTIALAGTGVSTGIPEVSNILFKVEDSLGNIISGEDITFSISTQAQSAGVTLQTTSAISNANGEVTATVQSGSVSTSFRVTATVTSNTTLSTQSTPIVVATGLPDQDSLSLALEKSNPQVWNHDLVEISVTAQVADRFNNPIQDGTSILFKTELGNIDPSCETTGGSCSVKWTSSAPRGTTGPGSNAGRTTIFATVDGEESFQDNNSNGFFDDGDFLFKDNNNSGTFDAGDDDYDLTEAFSDNNENGTYDAGEFFHESDNPADGFTGADGLYNGPNCQHTSLCSTTKTTTKVRKSAVLIMAEDIPKIVMVTGAASDCDNTNANTADDCYDDGATTTGVTYPSAANSINATGTTDTVTFTFVGATNYQVLPVGTKIEFTADNGEIVTGASQTVLNTSANTYDSRGNPTNLSIAQYSVTIQSDGTPSSDGNLIITVTPGGTGTAFTFGAIPIKD